MLKSILFTASPFVIIFLVMAGVYITDTWPNRKLTKQREKRLKREAPWRFNLDQESYYRTLADGARAVGNISSAAMYDQWADFYSQMAKWEKEYLDAQSS